MQLSAVILAGGRSRRMGRDKAWIEYGGKPLIELALENIERLGIREVFISSRPDQDYSSFNCGLLLDRAAGLGPLSGIELALREASSPLVLVLPVDLPAMTIGFLDKLIGSAGELSGSVARRNGVTEPLVAVYPKYCHCHALRQMQQGDYAVTRFVAACLRENALRLFEVAPEDAGAFANCNTPEDLAGLPQAPRGTFTYCARV